MSTGLLDNTFLLLLGAAGVWFVLRFVLGPRRGAPSLASFFRREAAESVDGLGTKAIATLLADMRGFVAGEESLRGLLLAGPFAARQGKRASLVTFIALGPAPERYAEPDWLLRWAYPARGHKILTQESETAPGLVSHHLTLRGAPPVVVHFVAYDSPELPAPLRAAFAEGASVIEDPTGLAERLRRRWETLLAASSRNASPNKEETT